MEFHLLGMEDRDGLTAALHAAPDRGCEYTFGNLYIWRNTYATKTAQAGGFRFVRFDEQTRSYLFPVGEGDLAGAMTALVDDAAALGVPFHMVAARREDCDELERLLPGRFAFHTSRDYAEYVYNSEDLIGLRGKKYHGKRNHISKFSAEYPDNAFEEITRDNIAEVRAMNDAWYAENLEGNVTLHQEQGAAAEAFDHFFELGFKGGCLRVNGRVVAFSMGEPINAGTFCTHIEKASYDVDGAYTVINQRFCERFCPQYPFVNREDDMGDEGLRRSKLSYYPAAVTEKFVVVLQ
ncbi:MAG: phosphatidylglycerol lysyltransferase domain-containing protein [Oscillospiraceae bacterium]|nr:phosphatidylglycerol lysyltransferase domain-containing protein [Oscillospiraceae bacterium]